MGLSGSRSILEMVIHPSNRAGAQEMRDRSVDRSLRDEVAAEATEAFPGLRTCDTD